MSLARCIPSYPGLSAWDGAATSTAERRGPAGQPTPGSPAFSPGDESCPRGSVGSPTSAERAGVPVSALPWDMHIPCSAKHPSSSAHRCETLCKTGRASPGEMQKFSELWVMLRGKHSVFSCLLVREKAEKGKQVLLLETATF